jgi:hypothetical protein
MDEDLQRPTKLSIQAPGCFLVDETALGMEHSVEAIDQMKPV